MIVDLTEVASWPRVFDLTMDPSVIDLDTANARLTGPVHAKGKVDKHAGWFGVKGLVAVGVEIDCSRCLAPIVRRLSIPFNVRFVNAEAAESTEKEVNSSDLDASEIEDDRIDLKEVIREQILLDLPEHVYCRDDCKGLCPKCGSDRNLIDCKCEEDEIDPRWAALKNLKSSDK